MKLQGTALPRTETLDCGVAEHASGCDTGWIGAVGLYIKYVDGVVQGFRTSDDTMASAEDLEADARRYSTN